MSAECDCRIEPDWLLIYRLEADRLFLECTGSHSDLFKLSRRRKSSQIPTNLAPFAADPFAENANVRAPFTPFYKLWVLSNDLGMDSKC